MAAAQILERVRRAFDNWTFTTPAFSAREQPFVFTWAMLLLLGSYYLFANTIVTALMSKTLLEGESAVLSNAVIEYALNGQLRYPLHAHDLFYPGVKVFMLHPPLHYVYVAQWVKAWGVGTLQLTLPSALLALLGIGLATALVYRIWGILSAALTPLITALHLNFYDPSLSLRCDIMLGFMMLIFTVVLGDYLLTQRVRWQQQLMAFLVGLSAVGCLSAHWLGAFTALPAIALLVVSVRRQTWRQDISSAVVGAGSGFLLWYGVYGADLWRSLVFVPLQGAQFHELLSQIPRSSYFQPFTAMEGGIPVVIGIALAILLQTGRLYITRATTFEGAPRACILTQADKACWYLIGMCGSYMLFLILVMANREPRYLINIYFLMLPLAGIGYAMAWQYAGRLFGWSGERRNLIITLTVASCLVPFTAWASPVISQYFTLNPFTLPNPNQVYAEIRTKLRRVTPADAPTLMGGGAYYFLYDVPLISPYRVVSSLFLAPIEGGSFFEVLRQHFSQRGKLKPSEATAEQLRKSTVAAAEVLIATDDCHSYQCRFYDPEVWRRDYYKVGTVLNVDVWLTGRRPPILKPTHDFLTIYFRKDVAKQHLGSQRIRGSSITYANGVGLLIYKPLATVGADVTRQAWASAPYGERRAMVSRLLDAHGWFGLSLGTASRDMVLDILLPKVNKAISRHATQTLDQAIDRAFLTPAVWAHLGLDQGFTSDEIEERAVRNPINSPRDTHEDDV